MYKVCIKIAFLLDGIGISSPFLNALPLNIKKQVRFFYELVIPKEKKLASNGRGHLN